VREAIGPRISAKQGTCSSVRRTLQPHRSLRESSIQVVADHARAQAQGSESLPTMNAPAASNGNMQEQ
jgi:hypothetical protein